MNGFYLQEENSYVFKYGESKKWLCFPENTVLNGPFL